ncbi:MAG: SseB family protein [Eubacteriales bacterium]|nr:SseB family protein [Eubacteriales bacterium]
MDINQPITNPELLNAIHAMRLDGTKEDIFFDVLFQSKLLCRAKVEFKNSRESILGRFTVGEGSTMALRSIENQQGERFLIAFTDWKEVKNGHMKKTTNASINLC